MTKYNNRKVCIDGINFDSVREAHRYKQLALLQKGGVIQDLQLQVRYHLIPKQEGERSADYIADFVYIENGVKVVEDSKGVKTKDYIIKRKLMLHVHGIKIREV